MSVAVRSKTEAFHQVIAGYRQAAAEEKALGSQQNVTDEAVAAAVEQSRVAAWRLIETPALTLPELKDKWDALQHEMEVAQEDGEPTDGRHYALLESVRVDTFRLLERA